MTPRSGSRDGSRADPGFARRERTVAFGEARREGEGSWGNHGFPPACKAIDKGLTIEVVRRLEKTKEPA